MTNNNNSNNRWWKRRGNVYTLIWKAIPACLGNDITFKSHGISFPNWLHHFFTNIPCRKAKVNTKKKCNWLRRINIEERINELTNNGITHDKQKRYFSPLSVNILGKDVRIIIIIIINKVAYKMQRNCKIPKSKTKIK